MMAAGRRDYGSGGIEDRGGGSWRIQVALRPDPITGRRRKRRFTIEGSKRDAQRALREALAQRDRGATLAPGRLTVGDHLDRWLRDHAALRVKASTLLRYRQIVARLQPLIGGVRLANLDAPQIQAAYRALLDEGLAERTVLHHHRLLKQALTQAVRWGLLASNPADVATAPRPSSREMRALTPAEVRLLEDATPDEEFRRILGVAVSTGLRLGELLGLRWTDLDAPSRRIMVRQAVSYRERRTYLTGLKTNRSRRSVAVSAHTLALLREQRATLARRRLELGPGYLDHDLVFPAPDGALMPPYRVSGAFYRLANRVGLGASASMICATRWPRWRSHRA